MIAVLGLGTLASVAPVRAQNDGTGPCVFSPPRRGARNTLVLQSDCQTSTTIVLNANTTSGDNGNTITAVDPPGGQFVGTILSAPGANTNVTDLRVTTDLSGSGACNPGNDFLVGIRYQGANSSGTVSGSRFNDIQRGERNGCQEGFGIDVLDGAEVTIVGNEIKRNQKGGIVVIGDGASARIERNEIEGDGTIDYIAQNGIQVSDGASAVIQRNDIGRFFYTAPEGQEEFDAAGIILFEEASVRIGNRKRTRNNFFQNEVNILDANEEAAQSVESTEAARSAGGGAGSRSVR